MNIKLKRKEMVFMQICPDGEVEIKPKENCLKRRWQALSQNTDGLNVKATEMREYFLWKSL